MMVFLIVFSVAILIAAVTRYGRISEKKIAQLRVGMNAREIIAKVGKPSSITTMGDIDLWVWVKANVHFTVGMKNGIAVSVPRIPKAF